MNADRVRLCGRGSSLYREGGPDALESLVGAREAALVRVQAERDLAVRLLDLSRDRMGYSTFHCLIFFPR